MSGGNDIGVAPPPLPRQQLDTLPKVRREAARLYAAARRGELPAADASKLGTLLALIARLLESDALERRLEALESKVLNR